MVGFSSFYSVQKTLGALVLGVGLVVSGAVVAQTSPYKATAVKRPLQSPPQAKLTQWFVTVSRKDGQVVSSAEVQAASQFAVANACARGQTTSFAEGVRDGNGIRFEFICAERR